ncbi:spore germination protein [Clostridium sp. YIM B02505]|uniref:Spore germination protein n=1 Tax=Clostridium yunnanense TaxID=2800325 RepID=A0ABS1EKM3_9CLOT|nr:spore germination protein [Clostridium yunnanense]MBK1809912.1 spore germination protein [Clostridium yunnanense]
MNILKSILNKLGSTNKSSDISSDSMTYSTSNNDKLSTSLQINIALIKDIFSDISDITYKDLKINNSIEGTLIFLNNFIDKEIVTEDLLRPLLHFNKNNFQSNDLRAENIHDYIKTTIFLPSVEENDLLNIIIDSILSGKVALIIDGLSNALLIELRKLSKRSISESIIEPVIRGPRDGFTEDIETNITLIRRRLKTPKLKVRSIKIGKLSQTDTAITYLDGIAEKSLVDDIMNKLSKIEIDAILESGYIEELLQSSKFSVFSEFGYTERPDRLASALLEGHVGIIVDNTPIVLIAPQTFFQSMQSSEDYYQNYIATLLLRFIRYVFLINALLLPSFYIAVLCFHQGMIPRNLLLTIIASRQGVPFPVLVEALLMEGFFEGLREAGIRLPSPAGQTVSIVGALVIGEAAVKAGIVSSSMVIIVSITGISSFIIPRYNLALSIRVLRFGIMILSGTLGLYGLYMGVLFLLIHLAKIESFGTPYLSPLAPLTFTSLKDTLMRMPWWGVKKRPSYIQNNNLKRHKVK